MLLTVRAKPGTTVAVRTYPGFEPVYTGEVGEDGFVQVAVAPGRYAVMGHAPGYTSGLYVVDVWLLPVEVSLQLLRKPVRGRVTVETLVPGPSAELAAQLGEALRQAGLTVERVEVAGRVVVVEYVDYGAPLWVVLALVLAVLVALVVLSYRVDLVSLAREAASPMWALAAAAAAAAAVYIARAVRGGAHSL